MKSSPSHRRVAAAILPSLAVFSFLLVTPHTALAALSGQPATPKEVVDDIRASTATILKGDIATGRPKLFLLVEKNATSDITDLLSRVIGDDTTYNGLASTFDEAINAAKSDTDRAYLIYNEARLHLLRANLSPSGGPQRNAALDAAAQAADRFNPDLNDRVAWELKGDIASYRGDLETALATYKKMSKLGGSVGFGLYKQGMAYWRANQPTTARTVLLNAYNSEKMNGRGGPALKYDILQALSSVYAALGNDTAALDSLAGSLKVSSNPEVLSSFSFHTEAARSLLRRGYTRQVLAYAESALRYAPDNPDLLRLRDEARGASGR